MQFSAVDPREFLANGAKHGGRGGRGGSRFGQGGGRYFPGLADSAAWNKEIIDMVQQALDAAKAAHGSMFPARIPGVWVQELIAQYGAEDAKTIPYRAEQARIHVADLLRRTYKATDIAVQRMISLRWDTHLEPDSLSIDILSADAPDSFPADLLSEWPTQSPEARWQIAFDPAVRARAFADKGLEDPKATGAKAAPAKAAPAKAAPAKATSSAADRIK